MVIVALSWGCPEPATDARRAPDAARARDGAIHAGPDVDRAERPDARVDGGRDGDGPMDAVADAARPVDAVADAAAARPDGPPAPDAAPDPCAEGPRRPRLQLGPSGAADFSPWVSPAALPLVRLAQGGSVTPFDVLAAGTGASVGRLTVIVTDLDDGQELAFGASGDGELPCRPGVGRVLADQTIDYAVEFRPDALLGRRVRLEASIETATGTLNGAVEGVLEAAL